MSRSVLCLQIGLGGIVLVAVSGILYLLVRPDPIFAPTESPGIEAATSDVRATMPAPPNATGPSISALADRPLFEPGRRPYKPPPPAPPPPPVAAPPPPAPPPAKTPAQQGYQLTGTLLIQGKHVAMLRHQGAPRTLRVSEGAEVGGWTAVRIQQGRITFRLGDREDDLELPRGDARGAGTRATAIR